MLIKSEYTFISSVSPGGVIKIADGKDVVYQDVINVTCKENQIGKVKFKSDGLLLQWSYDGVVIVKRHS